MFSHLKLNIRNLSFICKLLKPALRCSAWLSSRWAASSPGFNSLHLQASHSPHALTQDIWHALQLCFFMEQTWEPEHMGTPHTHAPLTRTCMGVHTGITHIPHTHTCVCTHTTHTHMYACAHTPLTHTWMGVHTRTTYTHLLTLSSMEGISMDRSLPVIEIPWGF